MKMKSGERSFEAYGLKGDSPTVLVDAIFSDMRDTGYRPALAFWWEDEIVVGGRRI